MPRRTTVFALALLAGGCATISERSSTAVEMKTERLEPVRRPESDVVKVDMTATPSNLVIQLHRLHACDSTLRKWAWIERKTEREASRGWVTAEAGLAVTGSALLLYAWAANLQQKEDQGLGDQIEGAIAAAGLALIVAGGTALVVDLVAARDETTRQVVRAAPDVTESRWCGALPMAGAAVGISVAGGPTVSGVTDRAGEAVFSPGSPVESKTVVVDVFVRGAFAGRSEVPVGR